MATHSGLDTLAKTAATTDENGSGSKAVRATLEFEEARLAHCVRVYESEVARTEVIEKKAQFYLGLITLFLSAVFLKIEFLEKLDEEVRKHTIPHFLPPVLYISLLIIAAASLAGLAAIVACTRVRRNLAECPHPISKKLFSNSSTYLAQARVKPDTSAGHIDFLRLLGKSYAFATEDVVAKNKQRAYWLKVATGSVFTMIVVLAVFLAGFASVFVSTPHPEGQNAKRSISQAEAGRSGGDRATAPGRR